VRESDRPQTTDHATKKCVAVGGIVCAKAILPKNRIRQNIMLKHSDYILQSSNVYEKSTMYAQKLLLLRLHYKLISCYATERRVKRK